MDDLTALLLRAQRGDRTALERFVALTNPDVRTMCRLLGDPDSADDLAQEAYARAIAALPRFAATGTARNWLLTITRRTCADETRRRTRARRLMSRVRAEPVASSTQPDSTVELEELLADLDADRREAFTLTQVLGVPYDEAAQLLRVPIGTIRSRVARARRQLLERQLLERQPLQSQPHSMPTSSMWHRSGTSGAR